MVNAHGGTIAAQDARGGGARFVVSLPAAPPDATGATADGATADDATADGATADGATADGRSPETVSLLANDS